MPRLNELQTLYGAQGLAVVGANHVHTDTEIDNFITTYGVTYGIAMVADNTGYAYPMYSTIYAIDRDGKIVWIGPSNSITNEMVEDWLNPDSGGGGGDGDEEEACSATQGKGGWPALTVLGALACMTFRQRKHGHGGARSMLWDRKGR